MTDKEILRRFEEERFTIEYLDDNNVEQIFCYCVTPGVTMRIIVTEKTYEDRDTRYEIEIHSSLDKIHWAYNFYIDKAIKLCSGIYDNKKEVWKHDYIRK